MADYTIVSIHAHESNQKKSIPQNFWLNFQEK